MGSRGSNIFFTSKRILYLQEYIQLVVDWVLPCNTFKMHVYIIFALRKYRMAFTVDNKAEMHEVFVATNSK